MSAGAGADVVDRYFAAVNSEDWRGLRDLFTEHAVLTATGARTRHGRDDVGSYYPRVLSGYAEHLDLPVRRLDCGSTTVVEISFAGRRVDGRPVAFDAVDLFDLVDGRIARLASWYDTAAVAAMLG
ncbi:nuclear transport factor 2 family protein [Spirillospora sp. NPDC048819]|uniref:nuclear transport factor 2 family protein n=1 Tax=Spirillospora sp. NPDC048819 TaxID=3155268 RepID=UPI0033E74286